MTFKDTDIFKKYKHPNKEKVLKYVEFMNDKNSTYIRIENIEERKKACQHASGLDIVPEDKDYKDLVVYYLSYWQHHNKFSLLRTREDLLIETLKNMNEPIDEKSDEDQRLKNVKLKLDLDILANRLIEGIEELYNSIYGDFKKEGEEHIKQALSPEQRLKNKK